MRTTHTLVWVVVTALLLPPSNGTVNYGRRETGLVLYFYSKVAMVVYRNIDSKGKRVIV